MHQEQTVSEMVEEVLMRQAKVLVAESGLSLQDALAAVTGTDAGMQLRALGDGEHQYQEARYWQANLLFKRAREWVRQPREDEG